MTCRVVFYYGTINLLETFAKIFIWQTFPHKKIRNRNYYPTISRVAAAPIKRSFIFARTGSPSQADRKTGR